MSIASVTDFQIYARTYAGRLTIGTGSGDSFTADVIERHLEDAEAELQIKYGSELATLTGSVFTIMKKLECLRALLACFSVLSQEETTLAALNSEIIRLENALIPRPQLSLIEPDTAFSTPDYLEKAVSDD